MTTDLRSLPDRLDPATVAALHDAARQRAAQLRAEAFADAAAWLLRSVVAPAVAGVASLFRPSRRRADGAAPPSRRSLFPAP
jgi:hypothetical protein